jgi:hypothetical protein
VKAKKHYLPHSIVRCDKALFNSCGDRRKANRANNRRRAADNTLNCSFRGGIWTSKRALGMKTFQSGLCLMRLELQAESGLSALDAKSAKRVQQENRGASPPQGLLVVSVP